MLVEVEDLATYLDLEFTPRQEEAALMVLEGLEQELEDYIRRPLVVTGFVAEEYVIPAAVTWQNERWDGSPGYGPGLIRPYYLRLRNAPVTNPSAVVVQVNDVDIIEGITSGYVVRRWGLDLFNVADGDRVHVTYAAGLNGPEIKSFKLAILRAAAREMTLQVDDVVGLQGGDLRPNTKPKPPEIGFTEAELKKMNRYRRRSVL